MSNNFFSTPDSCNLLPHLRRPYTLGDNAPGDVVLQTFGVDVQSDCIYWVKRGWDANKESWLLDLGRTDFKKNEVLDYKSLGFFSGHLGAIDCNYRIQEAFRIAKDLSWIPVRGVGRNETGGNDIKMAKGFALIDVNSVKDKLHQAQAHNLWHISLDAPDRYCTQLMSEIRRGNVWDNERKANHFLDCEVYAFVAALVVG